jgi:hypothetical protein
MFSLIENYLNSIAFFFVVISAILGCLNYEKWKFENMPSWMPNWWRCGLPSKYGMAIIVLATASAFTAYYAQKIKSDEIDKIKSMYENIYTAWISLGEYTINSENKIIWEYDDRPLGLKDEKPKAGQPLIMTTEYYGYKDYPMVGCPADHKWVITDDLMRIQNITWFSSDEARPLRIALFQKSQLVKIMKNEKEEADIHTYKCADGKELMFVKVTDGRIY